MMAVPQTYIPHPISRHVPRRRPRTAQRRGGSGSCTREAHTLRAAHCRPTGGPPGARGPTAEISKFRSVLLLVSPDDDAPVSPWGCDWRIIRMPQREQLCLSEHLLCIGHFVKLLALYQVALTTTDQCKCLIISEALSSGEVRKSFTTSSQENGK